MYNYRFLLRKSVLIYILLLYIYKFNYPLLVTPGQLALVGDSQQNTPRSELRNIEIALF